MAHRPADRPSALSETLLLRGYGVAAVVDLESEALGMVTLDRTKPGGAYLEALELVLHRGYWPSGRELEKWERRELERVIRDIRRQRHERS